MRFSDAMPSKYLKASDIGNGTTLTIRAYQMEEVGPQGKTQLKPVLYFMEEKKGLVLTKTTGNVITELYGEEMDLWIGKRLHLYTYPKEVYGEMKPVIGVKVEMGSLSQPTGPSMHEPWK